MSAIGNMAMLANKIIIISCAPTDQTDDQLVKAANNWTNQSQRLYVMDLIPITIHDSLRSFELCNRNLAAISSDVFNSRQTVVATRRRRLIEETPSSIGSGV